MNKNKILALSLLTMSLTATDMAAQVSFGNASKFNDGWKFSLKGDSTAIAPEYNDKNWRKLNLPHDWSVEGQYSPTLASCTAYLPGGIGWYRKTFTVNDTCSKHYIYFEGVYNRSEVYLNGHLLGKRPNGYVSFMYDMTPYLIDGENVLSVKVDHSKYADSRWYTGSGIYRDVWMVSAGDSHIAQWGVGYNVKKLDSRRAVVDIDVAVENPGKNKTLHVALLDADHKIVAEKSIKSVSEKNNITLNVSKPHRWALDNPYLYSMKVTLKDNNEVIDGTTVPVGFRTLEFSPDKGFALNGKWMKVKGVCLHHDAGVLGAAVPEAVWKRRLQNLKEIGVNAIRMSHNPQAPVLYDLCDQLGLLVMDEASDEWEFPKRKWINGWNQGIAGYDGTFDFFEEWIERDVADMVRRDRNHPSIFLWSIGNEVDYPNDPYSHPILNGAKINQPMYGGYKPDAPNAERIGFIAQRLSKVVKSIDTTRPTTGALAGVVMSNETLYPKSVDVVGYNYTEDRYDQDHKTYPDRIIYGSENGAHYGAWKAVTDHDFIFGQFIWTGTDYLGEAKAWPSRGLGTGLLDFGSFTKPRGYFRASLWSEKPMAYIGTYPKRKHLSMDAWDDWNYEAGQEIRVVCYTNGAKARLLLNGNIVGETKEYDESTGIIHWDIPYSAGELKVEAFDKEGNVIADYSIKTSDRPYSLSAKKIGDDDAEISHVVINILDENGNIVKLGDNDITCRIEGPAELLGLEGSNDADMSNYNDNHQRAYRGQLLAYIRHDKSGNEPIKVTFTSPLLKPVSIKLR